MAANDHSHVKVVLIDDDTMILRSLQATLAEYGFAIQAFSAPLAALDWVAENGADIVISDIRMPECDGFDVLKRVKEVDPQCDVIFITAHGLTEIAVRALREGATDFFEKPFTAAALKAAMERTTRFRVLQQQKELLSDRVRILSGELLSRQSTIMIGQSSAMKDVARQIVDVAPSQATVLITGESGTGKELVANAIHGASPRKDKPFLTLNCASIPEDLFEAEMFGHRRGAFTGAVESRSGYVEAAQGGTLFLDEIGDLPIRSQAKILRLLEQRTYLPVGERQERVADLRVLVATNQSLETLVREKKFREDLYYRLHVCVIRLPPLRERKEDIPLLALYFCLRFASEMNKPIDGVDDAAMRDLSLYSYPGNVRELRNIVESSIIHCKHDGRLRPQDLPELRRVLTTDAAVGGEPWPIGTIRFEEVERKLYEEALHRTSSNVSEAARLLGLSRGKLRRRLTGLGMSAEG